MRHRYIFATILAASFGCSLYACGGDDTDNPSETDAGPDAKGDVKPDTSKNDASEAGNDATDDRGNDTGHDQEAGPDDAGDAGDASDAADASDADLDASDASDGDADDGDTGPDAGDAGAVGKVMVVRAGALDGTTVSTLTAQAFLDEFDPSTGTLVRSIALPTAISGDNQPLFEVSHEINYDTGQMSGFLSRSADGHYVVLAGYSSYDPDVDGGGVGTPAFTTQPADHPRVVARVDSAGNIDTTTLISNVFAPDMLGGAALSGTDVWIGGTIACGCSPLQYVTFGNGVGWFPDAGTTNGSDILSPGTPRTSIRIFDGQLYASRATAIAAVGTGLPTTSGQTETDLVSGLDSAYEFELLDTDGVAGADVLYVAEGRLNTDAGIAGGVKKFTHDADAGTWTLAATFTDGITSGLRGLTAYKEGSNVIIVATTSEGDKLLKYVDDGVTPNPSATVLSTLSAGVVYRGVTLSPTP